jgi:predicted MFS family arabinose efflux permease
VIDGGNFVRTARDVSLIFAVSGATQASWMSRLPSVLEQTGSDFVRLGFALVMLGLGTMLAMTLTGAAATRWGSRRVVTLGFGLTLGCLAAIALTRSPEVLAIVLFGLGVGGGVWDAGMNMQGYAVQSELGKHLMSRFHGWWSVGSMAGAGLALAAVHLSVPLFAHMVVVSVLAAGLCGRSLASFNQDKPPEPDLARSPAPARRPVRRLAAIGVLIFCGATVEGAAGDWLAVFLHKERGLSQSGAALAYALFVTAMAAGRLAAERPHRHVGATGVVRTGALLAGVSIAIVALSAPQPWGYVGAVGWGVGICWVFPAALTAAGDVGTAATVAHMTAVGYSASIFGPLAIGWLAHGAGLGPALVTLLPLALAVSLLASVLAGGAPRSTG